MGRFVFGEDDHAAGLAVEPMDGEDVAIFFSKPGFEGRFFAFAIRDAEHSGGFVDGDEGFVFEEDFGMVLHVLLFFVGAGFGFAGAGGRLAAGAGFGSRGAACAEGSRGAAGWRGFAVGAGFGSAEWFGWAAGA